MMKPLVYGLKLAFVLGLVLFLTRCTPSQWEKSAESAYAAEIQLCVAQATSLEESKECRRQVDAKWGVSK